MGGLYTLIIDEKEVNFSGQARTALAINNQIPGPVLTFNEGDTVILHVKNELKDQETSIHWHGILLPNQWQADTDSEWQYGFEWILSKDLSIVANHDSDYGAGFGLGFKF